MSIEVQENVSLRPYNTFGIEARARFFINVQQEADLQKTLIDPAWKNMDKLILGGGSNILLTRDVDALVIRNGITGIERIKEDDQHVWVQAGAGEIWHNLVLQTLEWELGGIENLSLIPGTVGAAPMQNIGAYGVEIKEVFETLHAIAIEDGTIHTFDATACRFGYRDSFFKQEGRGRFIITQITLKLHKRPTLNTSYGAIADTLNEMGITHPTIRDVSRAVIHIRQSKLPDPAITGNAGSFFKNPSISEKQYDLLKKKYPDMPGYPLPRHEVKVPAGWLIEQCGWKGYRRGDAGVHARQALVLVNHGKATGSEIYALALEIKESVNQKFGIEIQPEVNVI